MSGGERRKIARKEKKKIRAGKRKKMATKNINKGYYFKRPTTVTVRAATKTAEINTQYSNFDKKKFV